VWKNDRYRLGALVKFVIQGLCGRDLFYIARSALPFLLLLILAAVIITVFPEIVTWLPRTMTAN